MEPQRSRNAIAWLEHELQKWFDRFGTKPWKWSENRTGRLLRRNLEALGNFKERPRGNPSLGGMNSQKAQLAKFGRNMMLDRNEKVWKRGAGRKD
jgi:hypothetical protein